MDILGHLMGLFVYSEGVAVGPACIPLLKPVRLKARFYLFA